MKTKKYLVSYRDEISVEVEAENEEQAIYVAEQSDRWSFLLREGHKDFFEVEETENVEDKTLSLDESCIKCGKSGSFPDGMCDTCAKERGR